MTHVQPHAGPTTVDGTAHSSATLYEAVQTLLRSKNTATGLSRPGPRTENWVQRGREHGWPARRSPSRAGGEIWRFITRCWRAPGGSCARRRRRRRPLRPLGRGPDRRGPAARHRRPDHRRLQSATSTPWQHSRFPVSRGTLDRGHPQTVPRGSRHQHRRLEAWPVDTYRPGRGRRRRGDRDSARPRRRGAQRGRPPRHRRKSDPRGAAIRCDDIELYGLR